MTKLKKLNVLELILRWFLKVNDNYLYFLYVYLSIICALKFLRNRQYKSEDFIVYWV